MKRRDTVQVSWHASDPAALVNVVDKEPLAPDAAGTFSLEISYWPRDLAGEPPDHADDEPLVLEDVLLHIIEVDAGAEHGDGATAGDDALATFELEVRVDLEGKADVLAARDVSADDDLPAGWRVEPRPAGVAIQRPLLTVDLGPRAAEASALRLPVELRNPVAEEGRDAIGRSLEGETYEIGLRLRRRRQSPAEPDLARTAPLLVRLPADDPTLSEATVSRMRLAYESLWRLGVCRDPAVFRRWRAAADGLREADPAWEAPAPFRGPRPLTIKSYEVIEPWLASVNSRLVVAKLTDEQRKELPLEDQGKDADHPKRTDVQEYCGVTAARVYMAAGMRPHWSWVYTDPTGFLSTSRIPSVMRYLDPVSRFHAVPVRNLDGVPEPCVAGETCEALLLVEEFHRRRGARRQFVYFGDGRATVPEAARTAREAMFFAAEGGAPARIRPGDIIVVGYDSVGDSRYGAHITILEGACHGEATCTLCARDGLQGRGDAGPFIHLMEGNASRTANGTYLVWEPALERELDLDANGVGRVRDAAGTVEDVPSVVMNKGDGRAALAERRLAERGVRSGGQAIRSGLVQGMLGALGTTHLGRRRRRLTFERAHGSPFDAPVIYAARLSPFDSIDLPLVELVAPSDWATDGKSLERKILVALGKVPAPVPLDMPRGVTKAAEKWREAQRAHIELYRGGPASIGETEYRARMDALDRGEHGDTPERAQARIAAGRARVERPDLLQWGVGAPDYPEGFCSQALPFVLAAWAKQIGAYDARILSGLIPVDPPKDPPVRPDLEALGLKKEHPADRMWPQARPEPGDVVVFTTAEQGVNYHHVAVATGEGDEILSLEPWPDDKGVAPLRLTTIGEYLERERLDTIAPQLTGRPPSAAAGTTEVRLLPHRF